MSNSALTHLYKNFTLSSYEGCAILTTCSSRESGDASGATGTSCTSREVVTVRRFSETT